METHLKRSKIRKDNRQFVEEITADFLFVTCAIIKSIFQEYSKIWMKWPLGACARKLEKQNRRKITFFCKGFLKSKTYEVSVEICTPADRLITSIQQQSDELLSVVGLANSCFALNHFSQTREGSRVGIKRYRSPAKELLFLTTLL